MWSYSLYCGSQLDATLENRCRYLWYFDGTVSFGLTAIVNVDSSANVWAKV